MHADDTTLFCNLETIPEENRQTLVVGLPIIDFHQMYKVFHTNRRKVSCPNMIIDITLLERVVGYNFLGLYISSYAIILIMFLEKQISVSINT